MAAGEEMQEAEELLAEGDTDKALERLQEAVAINPGNDGACYDYLRALLTAGRVDDARRRGGRARRRPAPASRSRWPASCCSTRGSPPQAIGWQRRRRRRRRARPS